MGGGVDVVIVEEVTDPGVEGRDDGVFTDVDGFGVLCFAGGVLGGEFAPVVGLAVVPGSLHSAPAEIAADQAGEYVGVLGAIAPDRGPLRAGEYLLGSVESVGRHDGGMGRLGRPGPLVGVVPAHLGVGGRGRHLRRR